MGSLHSGSDCVRIWYVLCQRLILHIALMEICIHVSFLNVWLYCAPSLSQLTVSAICNNTAFCDLAIHTIATYAFRSS